MIASLLYKQGRWNNGDSLLGWRTFLPFLATRDELSLINLLDNVYSLSSVVAIPTRKALERSSESKGPLPVDVFRIAESISQMGECFRDFTLQRVAYNPGKGDGVSS